MEDLSELIRTVLNFVQEYKIWILIGIGILFIDRIVAFINALFTLFGNFGKLIGRILAFLKAKTVALIKRTVWIITYPIRAMKRHALKRSVFYVVPE